MSNRVKVKATERIRPDCVYLVHGFGHTAQKIRHAFGKGASDTQLLTRYKTDRLISDPKAGFRDALISALVHWLRPADDFVQRTHKSGAH